ncbi:MAG: hypothetical protein ABF755_07305 [Oenococcus oeni]|uniref:hypothetical protein n=1 Tax=Oenococcus oeni TaxID=1247 RepID=UPI0008F89F98|nr:hypothetical protein [Oenococcus oeni]OIM23068.1 hypothetical protein ATX60_06130 [Oenococcus oeni]SYV99759.1 conserved hypothetical protein [Oenococcus oeni]
MSYTVNESTFDELEDKADQLHDLMFILSNYSDMSSQTDMVKLYDAYQHIASITSSVVSLVDEIDKGFNKMESEYLASMNTKVSAQAVSDD